MSALDQATNNLPQGDAQALESHGEMLVEPSELLQPSGQVSADAAASNDQPATSGDGTTTTNNNTNNEEASTTAAAATCTPAEPKHAFAPLSKIHLAFHAYHVPAHDRTQVVEAYHFCSGCATGGDDTKVYQCLIYDSAEKDARLIGIEYVVSEEIFKVLPEAEKVYWHSHKHEIASGLLAALGPAGSAGTTRGGPGQDAPLIGSGGLCGFVRDEGPMRALYNTYGKTIHVWADPSSSLPLGPPVLMMSTTYKHPGAAAHITDTSTSGLVAARDKLHAVDSVQAKKDRAEYLDQDWQPDPRADQWEPTMRAPLLVASEVPVKLDTAKRASVEDAPDETELAMGAKTAASSKPPEAAARAAATPMDVDPKTSSTGNGNKRQK